MGEGYHKQLWSARTGGHRPVLATCPDEAAQADAVCDTILEHYEAGVALRGQAVLARASSHTDLLEIELHRRHIPFVKYGGLRFLETAHIRDLVACLRILDNPFDELAWPRVLGLLDGVGPATITRVLRELDVGDRRGPRDPLSVSWDRAGHACGPWRASWRHSLPPSATAGHPVLPRGCKWIASGWPWTL